MEPLISIITPCYNSADFISDTIQSVVNQSYNNWELILIDDNSKDETCAIIKKFTAKYNNIQLIKLDKNAGVSNARNLGLAAAKGKYVAFLDSDDIWLNNKLKIQVNFMEKNSLVMCFGSYKRINESGSIISGKITVPKMVNYGKLLSHNVIIFSSSMVLKRALVNISFKKLGHEDWVFWLDLFKNKINGYGINEELVHYRVRKNSISSNKFKAIGFTWNIFRQSEKLGFLKSIYHFGRYAFLTVVKQFK